MTFQEQMTYARERNKQQSSRVATTTANPPKTQMTLEQYRTSIVSLALIKLKQKKEQI